MFFQGPGALWDALEKYESGQCGLVPKDEIIETNLLWYVFCLYKTLHKQFYYNDFNNFLYLSLLNCCNKFVVNLCCFLQNRYLVFDTTGLPWYDSVGKRYDLRGFHTGVDKAIVVSNAERHWLGKVHERQLSYYYL